MNKRHSIICFSVAFFIIFFTNLLFAQIDRFKLSEGKAIEVWRITDDPAVRDHANYHNTQCWSPDGRYLCYTHYSADV